MHWFWYKYFVYLLPALTIALIVYYFIKYHEHTYKPLTIIDIIQAKPGSFFPKMHPLNKGDIAPMAIITVIYAAIAFFNLGSNENPQTFHRFTEESPAVLIDLGEEKEVSVIAHYTGNFHARSGYIFETSSDGTVWRDQADLKQDYAHTFHWFFDPIDGESQKMRYLRITAQSTPMELGEICLFDKNGNRIDSGPFVLSEGAESLFDESDTVPEKSTYLNSTYFDEIYHARTAYEFLNGFWPYENTHPPLGKILIGIGISLFGMTPFGWRFVGTLLGVLMVPLMYIFIKNLFGKRTVAIIGTLLFTFDFMHYVQTRIATIDTYGVFFTILMYYFMYRFISSDFEDKAYKQIIPLALSGVSFGLGIASKWTGFYAATGLVVLYFLYIVRQGRKLCGEGKAGIFAARLALILIVSIAFFVAVPAIIYYLSYIPYAEGMGEPLSLKLVWENQTGMFNYHKGVDSKHSYASRWWMWIFNIRPILYYLDYPADGMRASFGAFLNPIVCWGGLVALLSLLWRQIKRQGNGLSLFIMIGYAAQLVPWLPITRITFAYHYFPSVVFLVLALCYTVNEFIEKAPKMKRYPYGLCGVSVFLFALFYPVLTGLTIPEGYSQLFLRWFPSWPF